MQLFLNCERIYIVLDSFLNVYVQVRKSYWLGGGMQMIHMHDIYANIKNKKWSWLKKLLFKKKKKKK